MFIRWRINAKCFAGVVVEALDPLHPSGRERDQLASLLAFAVVVQQDHRRCATIIIFDIDGLGLTYLSLLQSLA